jgi:Fur family ferric uptake transcriptional regulator
VSCYEKFRDELRARGFRLTPQREAILRALHELPGRTTTAEALHERAQRSDPGLDLVTVYRTLEVLSEIDFVKCIETGRKERLWEFLGTEHPHPHLLCQRCGGLFGLDETELASLRGYLHDRYGFDADLGQTTIPGICPKCRSDN